MAAHVPVIIALDWTPNTNHTGFLVAKEKGWYEQEGLDVKLLSPHVDGYKKTPASRVTDRTATFALAPSETVLSNYTSPDRDNLVAVATLLQDDLSAIVTLKSSGISRPKELDGKKYASYGARYEGRIVQALIKADGGKGDFTEATPDKLGIWETLLKGEADATWVFRGWEGVEAQLKGVELNEFVLKDFGIPYGYSPVVVAHPDTLHNKPEVVRAFLKATAKGFEFAAKNVELAASILEDLSKKEEPGLESPLDPSLVLASQRILSEHYLDSDGRWGVQSDKVWDTYLDWLSAESLLTSARQSRDPVEGVSASLDDLRAGKAGDKIPRESVKSAELFTNEYLT